MSSDEKEKVGEEDSEVDDEESNTSDKDESEEENNQELSTEELNDILENTDEEVLKWLLEESRPTINTFIEYSKDIDKKAGRTIHINILILGVILTIASISVEGAAIITQPVYDPLPLIVGILSSIVSIIFALITYTRSKVTAGLSSQDIRSALKAQMSEKQILLSLVVSHIEWIDTNKSMNRQDSWALLASHIFMLLSIGYYLISVVSPMIDYQIGGKILLIVGIVFSAIIIVPQYMW